METIGSRIKHLREKKNMTQTELSEMLGMKTYTTVSKWESDDNFPKGRDLKKLAEIFNVSSDYLLGIDLHVDKTIDTIYNQLEKPRQKKVYNFAKRQLSEQNNKVVPLVGATAANPQVLSYADPVYDTTVNASVPDCADCALVIHGKSMEPEYKDGSIVFYKRQESVENGELAIVDIDGDGVTFKKVIFDYDNQQVILRSLNKKYEDRVLKDEEYKIVGKVVK